MTKQTSAKLFFVFLIGMLVCFSILIGSEAFAASKTFTWSNPIEYEDGTTLPAADLIEYDLGCTTVTGDPYRVIETFPASLPLPTSHTIDLPPGEYWCVLRVATANAESAWSNEVFFILPFPTPRAIDDLSAD